MSSPRELVGPSSGLFVFDDFVANDSVADAAVGALDWEVVAITNAGTLALQTQAGLNNYGVLRHSTGTTADGDGAVLRTFTDGLLVAPGTEIKFKARLVTSVAGNNFRIGLQDSVTATAPTVGIWFDSNAGVVTCEADSADHGDNSQAVTGHANLTSGTTMTAGTWYDFEIKAAGNQSLNAQGGPSEVDFFLDGTHVAKVPCAIDDDEEVELSIVHWQDTGSGADRIFEIDYIELFQPRFGSGN